MRLIELVKRFLHQVCTEEMTVDYICGNGEALPLPLSVEEESEFVRLLTEEAEKERAKTALIQHNLRLVVYIARKFENTGVDNDDLVSIGTIGLIKAINSFRADKNIMLWVACQEMDAKLVGRTLKIIAGDDSGYQAVIKENNLAILSKTVKSIGDYDVEVVRGEIGGDDDFESDVEKVKTTFSGTPVKVEE